MTMATHPADVLQEARNLITDPTKWTQTSFAKAANGKSLFTGYHKDAVCWCAMGAIEHVIGKDDLTHSDPYMMLYEAGRLNVPNWPLTGVATYNDTSTHQEVLALFDLAIEKAKES